MITSAAFAGKRYAVLGLARSGVATVEALLASGASVVAWDSDEAKRDALKAPPLQGRGWGGASPPGDPTRGEAPPPTPSPEGAGALSFADPLAIDLAGFDAVIVSPGVPLNRHPVADRAKAAGVPVIGDIELFAQARLGLPPHKVVGITGTNGKSTTTALVRHICETAGLPVLMGGNIGLPILSRDPLPEGGVYVLELSSYQIDLTFTLDCDVAVLLNITPDHLDRYDGFAGYAASKARLFAMSSGVAVIATEDDATKRIAAALGAPAQAGASDGRAPRLQPAQEHRVVPVSSAGVGDQSRWPSLQGPHNAQNVAAATAVARTLGIADDVLEQALRTYPGLPHRMERVAERDGVLFVNDSKATNPTSTAPALQAYPAIHWILGGLAKTDDLDACAPGLPNVRAAYTIGSSAALFAGLLRGKVPVVSQLDTLDAAVRAAAAAARPGETVLLSPACASFDQFTDFEARGDAFRAAVGGLA